MPLSDPFPPDCLVCRKQHGITPPPGGVIYEDELVFASHSFIPQDEDSVYLGLLFLEPRRHIIGLEEMNQEESQRIGALIPRLSRALKESTGAEHIYLFVLGHHVSHLHFWLVPRYLGTPIEYWGLRVDEWPGAPQGGPAEIQVLCDRMRHLMK
jgi:histidine triad (HIT) family protein